MIIFDTESQEKFKTLNFWAKEFEDFQQSRKALHNRLWHLDEGERDTIINGNSGLFVQSSKKSSLDDLEGRFATGMKGALRKATPAIYDWAESTHGIGAQTIARILGEIGHPVVAFPKHWEDNPDFDDSKRSSEDNPKRFLVAGEPFIRTVPQLWAYCGYTPDRKKKKDMTQEEALALGKTTAKSHLWNLSVCVVKAGGGPYREVYDAAKARNANVLIDGKPITKGHAHNRALRIVSKTVLEDMYYIAKEELLTQAS